MENLTTWQKTKLTVIQFVDEIKYRLFTPSYSKWEDKTIYTLEPAPLGYISKEQMLNDDKSETNPLIDILYDTYEINGYKIINCSEQANFSVVYKAGTDAVMIAGGVEDIIIGRRSVKIICYDNRYSFNNFGGFYTNSVKYRYELTHDLKPKLVNVIRIGGIYGILMVLIYIIGNILSKFMIMLPGEYFESTRCEGLELQKQIKNGINNTEFMLHDIDKLKFSPDEFKLTKIEFKLSA